MPLQHVSRPLRYLHLCVLSQAWSSPQAGKSLSASLSVCCYGDLNEENEEVEQNEWTAELV